MESLTASVSPDRFYMGKHYGFGGDIFISCDGKVTEHCEFDLIVFIDGTGYVSLETTRQTLLRGYFGGSFGVPDTSLLCESERLVVAMLMAALLKVYTSFTNPSNTPFSPVVDILPEHQSERDLLSQLFVHDNQNIRKDAN